MTNRHEQRGTSRSEPGFIGWSLALTTLAIAVGVGVVKFLVITLCREGVCAEVLHADDFMRPVLTSLLGGALFVMGLVLVGTISDYKESERLPAEFVSALTSVFEEGLRFDRSPRISTEPVEREAFRLDRLRISLSEFVDGLDEDLHTEGNTDAALEALREIGDEVLAMERAGMQPTHVSRLRNEIANVRRGVLRIYHMQWTPNVISANRLLTTMVALILLLLVTTEIGGAGEAAVATAAISYFFVYLLRLRNFLDQPFRVRRTDEADTVSREVLCAFKRSLDVHGTEQPRGTSSGVTASSSSSRN